MKQRTANTGFASGGVTFKPGALCFYSSSVLADSFCTLKSDRMQSPKTLGTISDNRKTK